jgi:hypothetical protein
MVNWTIIVVVSVVVIFVILKIATRNKKYDRTREEVADLLDAFVHKGDWRAWDSFLSYPLKDPSLEAIRIRCGNLEREFPSDRKDRLFSEGGSTAIRAYIEEIRGSITGEGGAK